MQGSPAQSVVTAAKASDEKNNPKRERENKNVFFMGLVPDIDTKLYFTKKIDKNQVGFLA